ncbi:hypothetical protein ACFGVS_00610 [Mucilaginibacter sp. AW1-7]|uniref:hypothetical protein n=1 Tax=Mucilaginibacter sp. AW1-7 TaxID=3349874 RepID=UPI003F73C8EB
MKLILSILALLCLFFSTQAQEYTSLPAANKTTAATTLPPLKPGDHLPYLAPSRALHNNGQPLQLSDFKGKLLIIKPGRVLAAVSIQVEGPG